MKKIIVVGAGAAGIIAAIAAKSGENKAADVALYEKNEKIGKKLFITGKGRCNITNASDIRTVMENVMTNPRFLYSAFEKFSNSDIMRLLEAAGCRLKTERGNRVFPASDRSSEVINTLYKILENSGVKIKLNCSVKELIIENGSCKGVILDNGVKVRAEAVIIATGGMSYKSTGSTGDGYRFAAKAAHKVTRLYPSLVPLALAEHDCTLLQGLSLRNVAACIYKDGKRVYQGFGELLFTHFGVSGPLILSGSSYAVKLLAEHRLKLSIDLKPALDRAQLDARVLRDFEKYKNKNLKNALTELLPQSLIPVIIKRAGLSDEAKVNEINKGQRYRLIQVLKKLEFTITRARGFEEAVITKGGVSVKEIEPSTMQSKLISGLYFAGEVLDLDALTGGYNLQIAWSTGWTAGISAADLLK